MEERNKVIFQLNQNNQLYTISTSLSKNKINFECKDSRSQIYENSFSLPELLWISRYFQPNHSIEQIQTYLNGIIEKQKIGINQADKALSLNLYLINNDQISIPLLKKLDIGKNQTSPFTNFSTYYKEKNDNIDLEKRLNEELLKNKRLEKENKKLKDDNDLYKISQSKYIKELNLLKSEFQKLKFENENLRSDLSIANKKISGIQNIQIDKTEIKKIREENIILNYQLNIKDNEIKDLKLKIQNNIIDRPKYDINDIMVVNFISPDFSVNEGIKCLSTDIFAEAEEKLYKKYDNLRNTNNMFTANGKPVLRFKKLCENGIKDGDKIQLIKLE